MYCQEPAKKLSENPHFEVTFGGNGLGSAADVQSHGGSLSHFRLPVIFDLDLRRANNASGLEP
jgi:hypothetical protein